MQILMIPNSNLGTLIPTLIVAAAMIIIFLFLPALIELKRPKDAGPRRINDALIKVRLSSLKTPLIDIEEGQKFTGQLTTKTAACLYAIPSLEVSFLS
jgi:hypothetical protein